MTNGSWEKLRGGCVTRASLQLQGNKDRLISSPWESFLGGSRPARAGYLFLERRRGACRLSISSEERGRVPDISADLEGFALIWRVIDCTTCPHTCIPVM